MTQDQTTTAHKRTQELYIRLVREVFTFTHYNVDSTFTVSNLLPFIAILAGAPNTTTRLVFEEFLAACEDELLLAYPQYRA